MTLNNRLYAASLLMLFFSCNEPVVEKKKEKTPAPGLWEIRFDVGNVKIPIELMVTDSTWIICNASEKIALPPIEWKAEEFHVKMPLFNSTLNGGVLNDSTLSGNWIDHSRDTLYSIPFTIHRLAAKNVADAASETRIYDATFSKDIPEDMSKAVGIFDFKGEKVTGTFLTETGDYRYLQGKSDKNGFKVACFDGAHLFYFDAQVNGDSLYRGKFHSGRHWTESWEAHLDPTATLRDPDSLTTLKNPSRPFTFKARSLEGDSILFDQEEFKDKVSIVQIWGSWCPNCTDESVFLKKLHRDYKDRGLQIIPVSFERGDNFEESKKIVTNQFSELGLDYKPYFGGHAAKDQASKVFSDLSRIMSYPTTIFIDKQGKVRKIHTGFYGPGTGDFYVRHTESLEMFVQQLLSE